MASQVIICTREKICDENLSLGLKADFGMGGMHEESSQDDLAIDYRDAGVDDLNRPIRGAHPSQDDEGMSELGKATAENPSSIITLNDEKDEGVNVEEVAAKPNVDTCFNSSEVKEEGKHSILLETKALCQKKPHALYKSVGTTETLNDGRILLLGKVAGTKEKVESDALPGLDLSEPKLNIKRKAEILSDDGSKGVGKQGKLGREEIIPSGKKKNDSTFYRQNVVASKMACSGMKPIVAAACLFLFFGGVHAFRGPDNQVVMRGEEAVLTCFTNTSYPIKWWKKPDVIFSGYDFPPNVRSFYEIANGSKGQYDLIVKYTDEQMAGFYTCQQSGDVKRVTSSLVVLDVHCSTMEDNDTAVVCTAVVTGGTVTILWEIIQKDGTTNATELFTISSSSDTVRGIQRQNLTTELILSGNDRHLIDFCRLTLNVTGRTDIALEPEEKMADNIPIYTVDIPCRISVRSDDSDNSSNSTGTVMWKIMTSVFIPSAIVLLIIIVVVSKFYQRRKSAHTELLGNRPEGSENVPLQSISANI